MKQNKVSHKLEMLHHSLWALRPLKTGIWSSSATQRQWQLDSPAAAALVALRSTSVSTELHNAVSPTISLVKGKVKQQPHHLLAAWS